MKASDRITPRVSFVYEGLRETSSRAHANAYHISSAAMTRHAVMPESRRETRDASTHNFCRGEITHQTELRVSYMSLDNSTN